MTILKELWTREIPDPEIKTAYQYVCDFNEKLEKKLSDGPIEPKDIFSPVQQEL